ncbi:MAG: ATP-dependent DNA helicase [Candidatus Hodarchaeota archaeon]
MTIRINIKNKEIRLSVRDISLIGYPKQNSAFISFKSAEIGREIHQKIQNRRKKANKNYQTEYFLKHSLNINNWNIIIRGRIDLIFRSSKSVIIEEIKSTFLKNFNGSPNDPRIELYKTQLQCYAWLLNQIEDEIAQLSLNLVMFNKLDEKEYIVPIPYQDMQEFIQKKLLVIIKAEEERQALLIQKIHSLENLQFPFEYRPYQEDIIKRINEIISDGLYIILEAPSGLGKTVVSLYPLISKAIIEDTKIFFLTAKNTQRYIVEKTLKLFIQQGVNFLAIMLKAKEKMCTNAFYFCHEDYCPFLRNYIQYYPESVLEQFIARQGVIDPEDIEKEALISESFCPFELALDIALSADIIIGDYNYVFHPRVALQRFFREPRPKRSKFYLVIDEAHNLVNRSLSYYSHNLSRAQVVKLKQSFKQLKRRIGSIPLPEFLPPALERIFRSLQTEFNSEISTHLLEEIDIKSFQQILMNLEEDIPKYLRFLIEKSIHWPEDPVLSFYYQLRDFVETAILAKNAEEFSTLFNTHDNEIKILCKDASSFLFQRLKKSFKSAIAISATITPFPFYRDLLGFPIDKTVYESYPSPFPSENRKIIIYPEIDTRYRYREHYYDEIAAIIQKTISIRKGKYFAFFPSFKFMQNVGQFIKPKENLMLLKQNPLMNDDDRQQFIRTIEKSPYILALAVSAGIFAEGIDFPGILDGVFVISPSLPTVSFEREILRQYYEEKFSNGFAYAYQFPGLTRTFQAAGRLIRTPSDRGIIIFMGKRFASPKYADYFPEYYYQLSPKELISLEPENDVRSFWERMKRDPIVKLEE